MNKKQQNKLRLVVDNTAKIKKQLSLDLYNKAMLQLSIAAFYKNLNYTHIAIDPADLNRDATETALYIEGKRCMVVEDFKKPLHTRCATTQIIFDILKTHLMSALNVTHI